MPNNNTPLVRTSITVTQENIDFTDDYAHAIRRAMSKNKIRRASTINALLTVLREEFETNQLDGPITQLVMKELEKSSK
jgi:hypothetical protein